MAIIIRLCGMGSLRTQFRGWTARDRKCLRLSEMVVKVKRQIHPSIALYPPITSFPNLLIYAKGKQREERSTHSDPRIIVIERNNSWAAQLESDQWMVAVVNWPSGINVWPVNGQRNGQLSRGELYHRYRCASPHVSRVGNAGEKQWRIKIVGGKLAMNEEEEKEIIRRESVNFLSVALYCFYGRAKEITLPKRPFRGE